MKIKKFLLLFSLSICLTSTKTAFAQTLTYDGKTYIYDAAPVYIDVNGTRLKNLSMSPVILDNRTLVPAKEVFESLGAVVTWVDAKKEVYIAYNEDLIILTIDDNNINKNGMYSRMDVAPKIINNKTMIPAGFTAELLGFEVGWDKKARIVSIDSDKTTAVISKPLVIDEPVIDDSFATGQIPLQAPAQENSVAQSTSISGDVSIAAEKNALVNITNIQAPTATVNSFVITASGKISDVKVSILEKKLILDITNSKMIFTNKNITVANSNDVSAIRSSQFQVEPTNVSRIVFDLKKNSNYHVSLSADRKQILVSFTPNNITNISFESSPDGAAPYDKITINADEASQLSISVLVNPDRTVIDIPNSYLKGDPPQIAQGVYVQNVRVSQFDEKTTRIVLDTAAKTQYKTSVNGTTAVVELYEPNIKNAIYKRDDISQLTLKKPTNEPIALNEISHDDQYLNNQYIITLPGNFQSIYGIGDYAVDDAILSTINFKTVSDKTTITFNAKIVMAYTVTEDLENIYITILNPKKVYNRIVILDPGHGGSAVGAHKNNISEKTLNFSVASKLYTLLDNDPSVKVYMTRFDDTNPSWDDRTTKWNHMGDMFISIHHNSNTKDTPNGTEVLYMVHTNESGCNGLTSTSLAKELEKNITAAIGTANRGVVNRPDLIVLNRATYPAVLIEMGFMTNASDIAKITDDAYQQKAAEAIYQTVSEMFEKYPRTK